MTDDQYHSSPRIGRSGLQLVAQSPRHYWHEYLDPQRTRKPPTTAMRLGSAVHALILEGPSAFADKVVIEPDVWPTKKESGVTIEEQKYRFQRINAGKVVIDQTQSDTALRMRESVMAHPAARMLLQQGQPERTILFDHPLTGTPSKAKPDWDSVEHNGLIVDLKTALDASPAAFAKAAINHWYHVQTAWYLDAYLVETGEMPKGFVFIVVENTPPHEVAVYYAPPEMIQLGRRIYEPVLELYESCRQAGRWPGYGDEIKPLTLPAWAFR